MLAPTPGAYFEGQLHGPVKMIHHTLLPIKSVPSEGLWRWTVAWVIVTCRLGGPVQSVNREADDPE